MLHQFLPRGSFSSAPVKILELLLVAATLGAGVWELCIGWRSPGDVAGISRGAVLTAGMAACAWLMWRRRGADRSVLMPLMFIFQLADFVQGLLEWQAKREGAAWPVTSCALGLIFLALIMAEELSHRKEAAQDSVRESKLFRTEDML